MVSKYQLSKVLKKITILIIESTGKCFVSKRFLKI